MSIEGRGVETMSDELFQELLKLMPCMYDIQVQVARNITRLSAVAFKKARSSTGTGKQWPFVLVKNNEYVLDWAQIRARRAREILKASPQMKKILAKAESAAHLMRIWNMDNDARVALEAIPFPGIDESQEEDEPERRNEITEAQIISILPHTIDIPVTTVARMLKISAHTMMVARQKIGLKEWPLENLRRGTYHISAAEVDARRLETIQTLPDTSNERRILLAAKDWHDAKKEVDNIVRNAKRARLNPTESHAQDAPPMAPGQHGMENMEEAHEEKEENYPLIEDPVTEEDHELKDWFASILDENEQEKQEDYWYEQGSAMTAEEQAYWDSLIDPIPDHIESIPLG